MAIIPPIYGALDDPLPTAAGVSESEAIRYYMN